jgi:large subunit ribosomal protein L6
MSRFAKMPIIVPSGIEIKIEGQAVNMKGPKGSLSIDLPLGLSLKTDDGKAVVSMNESSDLTPAFHGLYRSLVNNMMIGVSKGFEIKLNMIGVGYRAALEGKRLKLQVGQSHPIEVEIPNGVTVTVDPKNILVTISGADKRLVGQFAAEVRAFKPPEPYKGKGIRYENEYVRKKAGKAAKAKTAG